MNRLDNRSPVPLYVQLADILREEINSGKFIPGDKLAGELDIKKKYGVGRVTVQHAVNILVEEKILFRKQGKGTFVSYPEFFDNIKIKDRSFTAAFADSDHIPYTKLIRKSISGVGSRLIERFVTDGDPDAVFARIDRLRYINNVPGVYEIDFLSKEFESIQRIYKDNQSLFALFHRQFGIVPSGFHDNFRIVEATPDVAFYLNLDAGHPLLSVAETITDEGGRLLYHNEQIINTAVYTYNFNYTV